MSKLVQVPGVGEVEFPDDMSEKEIVAAIQRISPAKQEPKKTDMLSDIARQLGLTARAGISGAASLPLMVGDVMNAGLNLIPGVNLPSASQSAQNLMTAAGLPVPQNATERVSQDVASAMTGVGATAKLAQAASPLMSAGARPALDLFTQRLGMQTGSAAGAAGAAGAVREEGGGAGAQLAAGLTGGLLGPLVPQSVTAVTRGLREMISPMTRQGVESTAGNVLSQLSRDRTTALANLESYTPTVPGVTPTTAAAAKDYGLAGAERTLATLEPTGRFSEVYAKNNAARNILLDKFVENSATRDVLKLAEDKRNLITSELRDKAFANSQPVAINPINETIDSILKSPSGARQVIESVFTDLKGRIQKVAKDGNADPAYLYEIRKDINDIITGKAKGDLSMNARGQAMKELMSLRNAMDDVIEAGAPGFRDYKNTFAQMSKPVNQIETLRDIKSSVATGTEDPTTGFRGIAPVKFRKLVDDASGDLEKTLSKTQFNVLRNISDDIDRSLVIDKVKPAGSDTFKNFSMANIIGGLMSRPPDYAQAPTVANAIVKPLNWLYSGPDEQVKALLIDAMLDPKLAADLMKKATQPNVQKVSKKLYEYALERGYGPAFGLGNIQDQE
jgi:hypothetical protein